MTLCKCLCGLCEYAYIDTNNTKKSYSASFEDFRVIQDGGVGVSYLSAFVFMAMSLLRREIVFPSTLRRRVNVFMCESVIIA